MGSSPKKSIKKVSVVLRPKVVSEFASIIPSLTKWLGKRKKQIQFLDTELSRLEKIFKGPTKNINYIAERDLHSSSDLIITLGGDGTLIGVCRKATKKSPPVFGVNMGRLGFITEFSKNDFFDDLENAFMGRLESEKLGLYTVEVLQKGKRNFKGTFLNDAVISKSGISRMFTLSLDADEEHVYDLAGDGMIVSSPIGSTAYSLAAGGPIVNPAVGALVLTPICPHGLTHRPIVVPDKFPIDIRIRDRDEVAMLTLDGQQTVAIDSTQIIRIKRSRSLSVSLLKNPSRTYFHTLKDKFTHGRIGV